MSFTNIKNLENIGIQKICIDSSGTDKQFIYVCDSERNVLRFNKKSLLADEKPTIIEIPDATSASIAWYGSNVCFGYRKVDFIVGSEQQLVGIAKNGNFDPESISESVGFQLDVTTVDVNGEYIVGGSSDYDVKCIGLTPEAELKALKFDSEILCVKLDPRNEYLAVSTVDGNVTILKLDSFSVDVTLTNVFSKFESIESVVCCQQFKRNAPGQTVITSIEFSPFSNNQLIIADSNKGICMLHVSEQSVHTALGSENAEAIENESDDDDSIILNRTTKRDDLFDDEAMEDDGDTRMSSDISAIKRQFNHEADIGDLEEFGFKVGEPEDQQNIQNNLPGTSNEQIKLEYPEPSAPKKMLVPERFVCNSSPIDPEASQRFLKYNRFGIVRSYINEANKVSTIDIEFHDKSIHGDIHIDNFEINYELADISTKVVALASMENRKKEKEFDKADDDMEDLDTNEPIKEKRGTSILHVIPIQAFDCPRWSMTLPRGDGCLDVLCSSTQVVVLTKKRNIRVFTIGGIQRQVFTHFAPILTATCFDDRIAIASVAGSEFYEQKKTPQWRFEVVEYNLDQNAWYKKSRHTGTSGAVSRIDIPVETGEQLDWVAYSSQGKLAVMDSAYNVHVLSAPGFWVPIFQGSSVLRGLSDGIFPIGLTVKEFRYIYCRGSRSPIVNGINAPTTVEWKVPFCQPESNRTGMEQALFMNELAIADTILQQDADRTADETKELTKKIVNLFAWFVKANSDGQAAEIVSLVANGTASSARTIQNLCSYASKCKRIALSEKVAAIGRRMADGDENQTSGVTEIRPTKRIALASRKVRQEAIPVQERHDSDEDEDRDVEDTNSGYNPNLDVSMSSQPVQPLERLAKNPFAKCSEKPAGNGSASSSQASLSIFDQLETVPVDQRKRAREPELPTNSNPTLRKQAKLKFGTESIQPNEKKIKISQHTDKSKNVSEKENETDIVSIAEAPVKKSVSPYEMWLSETKSNLRIEFDGDEADFAKFCIQTFRALSKDQKEEWKAKAIAAAQD
ncbi:hypothetical protein CAEBREN_19037 [Caenorhabditis brenneri]|uniref:WDHD1/CFT4 second beta-propeller domain-containing protein n=1 Tax=Caenorhabditis brenneri TaxID=135651 RepID=G0N8F6_CAEBE|nr:hypothetical protein CAEBREN_19037 [Caenorhabditis brenneri]